MREILGQSGLANVVATANANFSVASFPRTLPCENSPVVQTTRPGGSHSAEFPDRDVSPATPVGATPLDRREHAQHAGQFTRWKRPALRYAIHYVRLPVRESVLDLIERLVSETNACAHAIKASTFIAAKFGKDRGLRGALWLTPVARRALWYARGLGRLLRAAGEHKGPRGFAPLLVGVAAASHGETIPALASRRRLSVLSTVLTVGILYLRINRLKSLFRCRTTNTARPLLCTRCWLRSAKAP